MPAPCQGILKTIYDSHLHNRRKRGYAAAGAAGSAALLVTELRPDSKTELEMLKRYETQHNQVTRIAYLVEDYSAIANLAPGVHKKVSMQVEVLRGSGFACDIVSVPVGRSIPSKILRRIPFGSDGRSWDATEVAGYDCLYIRKPFISRDFRSFLRNAKIRNPGLKVLLEVPTYPYDDEIKGLVRAPLLVKERWNRRKLVGLVDAVVDLSGHDEIFGVSTVQMFNGIFLERVQARDAALASTVSDGAVNVACMANFANWHGIDRFLAGMAAYYEGGGAREVILHLVGEGPELGTLWKSVKRLGLTSRVEFYGNCNREEMDAIFDWCSIAIECLGNHRKGITSSSSLKSREYLAKGIPFVYSGEVDVFRVEPVDFCLRVSADESQVDIAKLVGFHDELYAHGGEEVVIRRVRAYAERHVGMDRAMANVIDYIKENCGEEE